MPSYQAALERFDGVQTQVLGLSVDSIPSLQAWAESLGGITYPLLSDFYPHGGVAELYGVLREDGKSERAIFIIDKSGIIRYIDIHDIDDQPDNEILFSELEKITPPPVRNEVREQETHAEKDGEKENFILDDEVVLYCTTYCPVCRRARTYLKSHGIKFREVDISSDREAAAQVREWANGNETTPTFAIKGTVVVNFDRQRLDEVFGFNQ